MSDLPNVLVFSSGGYGHVPVPLYHQPEKGPEDKKPFAERQYLVSFVGTPRGPRNFRDRMSAVVHSAAQAHGFEVFTGHSDTRWRTIMHGACAVVPRGRGGRIRGRTTRTWLRCGQGCIKRNGASEAAPEAGRQAVGGGCQSGWGRLLSVANAVEAGTWRQGDNGWA